MITTVYFVRHAEPNFDNPDVESRELTPKGLRDRTRVTDYLTDKEIHLVFSSPYRRSLDTVRDFADRFGHEVTLVDDFRERKVSSSPPRNLLVFYRDQWSDFSYRLLGGECLSEVQDRNIRALKRLLAEHPGKNLVVGSHGTALSTIVNFFDPSFGYKRFEEIRELMPWVVKMTFDGDSFLGFESIDVFRK